MSVYRLPPKESGWSGIYPGSFYGTLWKTFNVDLDAHEGAIRPSALLGFMNDTVLFSTATTPMAYLRSDADCEDRYWASAPGHLIKTDSSSSPSPVLDWDSDALDSTPAAPLDFAILGKDSRNDSGRDQLFVTNDSGDISVLNDTGDNKWTGSWWVTKQGQTRFDSDVGYYPIEYFSFRKIGLVGDGNLVHTISRPSDTQNDTVTYARVTLPFEYVIRHIITTAERAWFLCTNRNGTARGAIVEWDGYSQSYNAIYTIPAFSVMTGVNYQETPVVLSNKGIFYEFDGGGFAPMYRNGQPVEFPIAKEDGNTMDTLAIDTPFVARVSPRGMAVAEDGLIYINARQPVNSSFRQTAGIWCLNPLTGRLYNKYGVRGATHANSDSLDDTTYGHQNIAQVGGILPIGQGVGDNKLMAGIGYYKEAADSAYYTNAVVGDVSSATGLYGTNHGYIVTQYIPASDIREFWDTIWLKYLRLRSRTSNSFVVKARGTNPLMNYLGQPLEATITWTGATTFTATLNADDDPLSVGDEVDILNGYSAGWCAHITTISGVHGALQTITIDEDLIDMVNSTTALARFDNWKKLSITNTAGSYEDAMSIGIDSSFVQFKIDLRGPHLATELTDVVVTSHPSAKIEG